ncbi:hypothetical protein AVEN_120722-1 [Araneus ventricosus]|uniref:Uncharacterized protein n=1 Tax=Araneus ventricosus TaxID=182803 RepID=A0A4Y2JJR8_ARAVE|nr:hypothetical protein AVEN_120722-1 [Araneus ventricosus]
MANTVGIPSLVSKKEPKQQSYGNGHINSHGSVTSRACDITENKWKAFAGREDEEDSEELGGCVMSRSQDFAITPASENGCLCLTLLDHGPIYQ